MFGAYPFAAFPYAGSEQQAAEEVEAFADGGRLLRRTRAAGTVTGRVELRLALAFAVDGSPLGDSDEDVLALLLVGAV